MFRHRLIFKIIAVPTIIVVTVIKWILTFFCITLSIVLNLAAVIFLAGAALSYLMGLASGKEVVMMAAVGFVMFLIPKIGGLCIGLLGLISTFLRDFLRS